MVSDKIHSLTNITASKFGKLSRQVDQREVPSPQLARGSTGHLIETRSVKVFKTENETFRQIFFQRRRTAELLLRGECTKWRCFERQI